jgi:hypothetical protein
LPAGALMRGRLVWHGLDVGVVKKCRLVKGSWQYEALVQFGAPTDFGLAECTCDYMGGACANCMDSRHDHEWIPIIELSIIAQDRTR